jgi:Na+/melibiose symporter-like transporter
MGAMGAMPPKFANLISGALLGFGLISIGFVAKTEMSVETLNGLKMLGTLLPALVLVIGIICFLLLNRLSAAKLAAINTEVIERREARENGEMDAKAAASQKPVET